YLAPPAMTPRFKLTFALKGKFGCRFDDSLSPFKQFLHFHDICAYTIKPGLYDRHADLLNVVQVFIAKVSAQRIKPDLWVINRTYRNALPILQINHFYHVVSNNHNIASPKTLRNVI